MTEDYFLYSPSFERADEQHHRLPHNIIIIQYLKMGGILTLYLVALCFLIAGILVGVLTNLF